MTYTVNMQDDEGEVDEETGEVMTAAMADEGAREWQESAMPGEYYPEDFVTVDEGPVEFLGMELCQEQKA